MSAVNFKPHSDKILVKPRVKDQQKTSRGIYIPAVATDKFQRGEVVAVGPGKRDQHGFLQPLTVAVGDVVVYQPPYALNMAIDGELYAILKEFDVFGVEAPADDGKAIPISPGEALADENGA